MKPEELGLFYAEVQLVRGGAWMVLTAAMYFCFQVQFPRDFDEMLGLKNGAGDLAYLGENEVCAFVNRHEPRILLEKMRRVVTFLGPQKYMSLLHKCQSSERAGLHTDENPDAFCL